MYLRGRETQTHTVNNCLLTLSLNDCCGPWPMPKQGTGTQSESLMLRQKPNHWVSTWICISVNLESKQDFDIKPRHANVGCGAS